MQRLLDGHRQFRAEIFPRQRELLSQLAGGQSPKFLFIICSDSRVQPADFLAADPGDLFIDRSLGNIVPDPGGRETEATAIVEYAVVGLGVEHIVVCGHAQCGAMKALLDPASLEAMPIVAAWLANAQETLAAVERKYGHLEGEALLDATIHENVLVQLERLRRQPCVAPRLAAETLQLHGWVYNFAEGSVTAHDPRTGRFVPMEEAYGPLTS